MSQSAYLEFWYKQRLSGENEEEGEKEKSKNIRLAMAFK